MPEETDCRIDNEILSRIAPSLSEALYPRIEESSDGYQTITVTLSGP